MKVVLRSNIQKICGKRRQLYEKAERSLGRDNSRRQYEYNNQKYMCVKLKIKCII